jgi:hypothetical protein
MLSSIEPPKTKQELARAIQNLKKVDFEVLEYIKVKDRQTISQALDKAKQKGPFTVVILR